MSYRQLIALAVALSALIAVVCDRLVYDTYLNRPLGLALAGLMGFGVGCFLWKLRP